MLGKRRKKKNFLSAALKKEESFLLRELEKEWDEIQRGARREEIIRRSKDAGVVIAKTLLVLLAVGGALTVAAVAPNVFSAFSKIRGRRGFFDKRQFREAKTYLCKRSFITAQKVSEGFQLKITPSGLEKALATSFDKLRIKPQKQWDGRWRIVIFDIPDRHKWGRGYFSKKLKDVGFYPMQESVFVSPYPCADEIGVLVSLFSLGGYVRLIEAAEISNDSDVRSFFGF